MRSVYLTLSSTVLATALGACTIYQTAPQGPPPPPPPPGAAPAAAAPSYPGYELLGTRVVAMTIDHDTLAVNPTNAYKALRLHVVGNALEMFDVRVVFGNDEEFSPDTRLVFQEGGWSRDLDLPGGARHIRAIKYSYKSIGPGGNATVHAYGRQ
ncbi:MAG: hypothetical protein IT373_08240 [Polyangiaceae bacterium]|nr:hypothetical protein [Polyangiaceae bacterium]